MIWNRDIHAVRKLMYLANLEILFSKLLCHARLVELDINKIDYFCHAIRWLLFEGAPHFCC